MKTQSYIFISDFLKLLIALIGVIGVYLKFDGGDFGIIAAFSVMLVVATTLIITVFDRMIKDIIEKNINIEKKIDTLSGDVHTNFEYHGLLDSPKDKFTAMEMRDKWPLAIDKIKREFYAINYVSVDYWNEIGANNFCYSLGHKAGKGVKAKRIFVIDSIDELIKWKDIIDIHLTNHISVRYILKQKFNQIKERECKEIHQCTNINGFNIIDKDNPGIVLDWIYTEDRRVDGAKLYRGPFQAKMYYDLFMLVWDKSEKTP